MFSVKIEKHLNMYYYTLQGPRSSAQIIPELGGMVHKVSLLDPATDETYPILEHDSDEELISNPWYRGRILFPFNDRIPDGKYTYNNQEYQIPMNFAEEGCAIHGFVYNKPFKVIKRTTSASEASLLLRYVIPEDTLEYYPFGLTLYVTYILTDEEFKVDFYIENTGSKTAPVSLGWHPYFILGSKVDDLKLTLDSREYIPVDDDLMPTGDICLTRASSFTFDEGMEIKDQELDIALSTPDNETIELAGKGAALEFQWPKSFFEYTQIFIPPHRKSIAIEPVTGATNNFNLPALGLNEIEPEGAIEGVATIRFKK